MKESYDTVIVGASSAGAYFARQMAQRGFAVLVIEKDTPETLSREYDVFHMAQEEMERYDLPKVQPGDGVYCFAFTEEHQFSPYGQHPKLKKTAVIGMHKNGYMRRMNVWAQAAGAEIVYKACFDSAILTDGRVTGVRFTHEGETKEVRCRLLADCSGKQAVVRRSLPADYGVEQFALTERDVFFVKLRYIKFDEPMERWLKSYFYMFYKSWISPSDDSADAIVGIGSSRSLEAGERFYRLFCRNVKTPPYHVVREETGTTPYRRPLYSFVADGFLCMGDAACLTKPDNGEGTTAALALEEIAAEVAAAALQNGAYPTREALWPINKRYNDGQGKEFALVLAAFARAVNHSIRMNDFLFKHDAIFSKKIIGAVGGQAGVGPDEIAKAVFFILYGMATGNIKPAEIGGMLLGGVKGLRVMLHYARYPATPTHFPEWVKKADRLWASVGQMADYQIEP